MMKRVAAAALAALFLAGSAAVPATAQTPQPAAKEAPAKKAPAKKSTKKPSAKQSAQRQKMRDCSTKWSAHRKATGEKGRAAHRKFMAACLKS